MILGGPAHLGIRLPPVDHGGQEDRSHPTVTSRWTFQFVIVLQLSNVAGHTLAPGLLDPPTLWTAFRAQLKHNCRESVKYVTHF